MDYSAFLTDECSSLIEELLSEKNHAPSEIKEKIKLKLNIDLPYHVVKNAYYRAKMKLFGHASNDAENLVELLNILENEQFIYFKKRVSQEGNLEAFVFATHEMLSFYHYYKDMLIIDTTFGLNRFNMPLLTFAGVKNTGESVILGFAVMINETAIYKKWVFETYNSFTNAHPSAIISDACPALLQAIKEVFPSTKSFLCAWHVQRNLKKHFSSSKKKLTNQSFSFSF